MSQIRISIDRGGTFTDCYTTFCDENGNSKHVSVKILSEDPSNYEDAPTEVIRRVLKEITKKTPARIIDTSNIESIRMGTTVATNALLERKGAATALLITKGMKDLLEIGTQSRPDIFDLEIKKVAMLYDYVLEIDERVSLVNSLRSSQNVREGPNIVKGISGEFVRIIRKPEVELVENSLKLILNQNIKSIAICFMHSFTYPDHEIMVATIAKRLGFEEVTISSELMPMIKIVSRGHSAVANAYLMPCIRKYINEFSKNFDEKINQKLLFMQSDGGLAPIEKFVGLKAILSGPAAGVVACASTSYNEIGKIRDNKVPLIGFDMGGTSTDVSRYDGRYSYTYESVTAGITIQSPQLDIHTIAAGGGSRLFIENKMFKVGPQSAGAHPGPVCYRKNGYLSVTDANLLLGRILPEYFPKIFGESMNLPLDYEGSKIAFEKLKAKNVESLKNHDIFQVALGFIKVANESMCRPIRNITESKGYDTSNHILSCFGGAGGQHACSIAENLGMRTIMIHRQSSVLSAFGLSLADVVEEVQEPCSYELTENFKNEIEMQIERIRDICIKSFVSKGYKEECIYIIKYLNIRYAGTDTPIIIKVRNTFESIKEEFLAQHKREFGFLLTKNKIMVDDVRIRAFCNRKNKSLADINDDLEIRDLREVTSENLTKVYFSGKWYKTQVHLLKNLSAGSLIKGPSIIIDSNSTLLIEPNWDAKISQNYILLDRKDNEIIENDKDFDPITLSIFSNKFMSIAEQMGETLRKTSVSTNIKERLDFSCALFGPSGDLIANAPHIPVHLGSLSHAVKFQLKYYRDFLKKELKEGDVIVTNDPHSGGSHLPDITVITPVLENSKIVFFVASRGHHADIGGILPGSMPPNSKYLYEEGARIKSIELVKAGEFQIDKITDILLHQPSKFPNCSGTRTLTETISDLKAQVAANNRGILLVKNLIKKEGLKRVHSYMNHIQSNAEEAIRCLIKQKLINNSCLYAEDYMDDGTKICLKVSLCRNGDAIFDFSGTGFQVYGNCNAPESITHSAIIYCLRSMVDKKIPLNQGCLNPIKVIIPKNSILSPSEDAAVVGGNVLTSQRLCDVIFKAFNQCAASQGCCNNLTFGKISNELNKNGWGYYETIAGGSGAGPYWHGKGIF